MRGQPYLKLTKWASGEPIYWPADDVGPLSVVDAREAAQLIGRSHDCAATVIEKRCASEGVYVRETPEQILAELGSPIVAVEPIARGTQPATITEILAGLDPKLRSVRLTSRNTIELAELGAAERRALDSDGGHL